MGRPWAVHPDVSQDGGNPAYAGFQQPDGAAHWRPTSAARWPLTSTGHLGTGHGLGRGARAPVPPGLGHLLQRLRHQAGVV